MGCMDTRKNRKLNDKVTMGEKQKKAHKVFTQFFHWGGGKTLNYHIVAMGTSTEKLLCHVCSMRKVFKGEPKH